MEKLPFYEENQVDVVISSLSDCSNDYHNSLHSHVTINPQIVIRRSRSLADYQQCACPEPETGISCDIFLWFAVRQKHETIFGCWYFTRPTAS